MANPRRAYRADWAHFLKTASRSLRKAELTPRSYSSSYGYSIDCSRSPTVSIRLKQVKGNFTMMVQDRALTNPVERGHQGFR